jgi:hypothetical protein
MVGALVVHLHNTKILIPVVARGEPQTFLMEPEAGLLLTRRGHSCADVPVPWAYNIDSKNTAFAIALCVLWDNSKIVCSI